MLRWTEYISNFHALYLNMDMDAVRNKIYIYLFVAKSAQFCSALVFLMGKGAAESTAILLGGVSGMFRN